MSRKKEDVFLSMVQSGELEIDTEGRIWRLRKRGGCRYPGFVQVVHCNRVRAEFRQGQGYLQIATTISGVRTTTMAHRVVWAHFNGEIPTGLTINHRNGVRDDNRPANLELATMSEQRLHSIYVLNSKRWRPQGALHPKTKLTEENVREMRALRAAGVRVVSIANRFSMNPRAVSAICQRRTWKHLE